MALSFVNVASSGTDSADGLVYSCNLPAPQAGRFYVASLNSSLNPIGGSPVTVPTGWTFIGTITTDNIRRLDVYWGNGDEIVPGLQTWTFGGSNRTGCLIIIDEEQSGEVDLTNPLVEQSPGVYYGSAFIEDGSSGIAVSLNTFESEDNAGYFSVVKTGTFTIGFTAPYAELLEIGHSAPDNRLATGWALGDPDAAATWTAGSADTCAIAFEVRSAAAPPPVGEGGRPVANNVKIPLYVPRLAFISPPPPPPSNWRDLLMLRRVGFAAVADVTGGYGGPLYTVTNSNDSGSGSLRAGCAGGNFIVFDPDNQPYNIDLASILTVGANTTISCTDADGNPVEVNLDQRQLTVGNNVIIHNMWKGMQCTDNSDDIFRIPSTTTKFWINECTIGDPSFAPGTFTYDEYMDMTQQSASGKMGTLSGILWLPGAGANFNELVLLIGNNQSDQFNDRLYLTMTLNYFNGVRQRMPLMGSSRLHSFNNVRKWQLKGIEGRADEGIGGARILTESDIFDASMAPSNLDDGLVLDALSAADVRDRRLTGGAIGVSSKNPGLVNVFEGWSGQDFSYTYEIDTSPTATLYTNIVAAAGRKLP